jgi:hypothetical protein
LFEFPCTRSWLFLRLLFIKKFSQTFLSAKIIISAFYSLPDGGSLGYIGLAIRVLDKFFRLGFSAHIFSSHGRVFEKIVKNRVKEEKKKDE